MGRTQFVGRTQGAFLYLTGAEMVFTLPPDKIEHKAKMRQVKVSFVWASLLAVGSGDGAAVAAPCLRLVVGEGAVFGDGDGDGILLFSSGHHG